MKVLLKQYAKDDDFKDVYEVLINVNNNEEVSYHVHNNLLSHLGNVCIPIDETITVISEAHTSLITVHYGVGKTISKLQRYCIDL